jgi:hypothetical protein
MGKCFGGRLFYPKVVQRFVGSELLPQPARLFATAGPGLRRILGISVLRKDLGVRATPMRQLVTSETKFTKALLEPIFFSRYFARQFGHQLFMKVP